MTTLRVAARASATRAEGPGLRYAVWVQGCSLRCPGCCNPEMFSPSGGERVEVEALIEDVARSSVEGLTLLGGEPFEQEAACAELAHAVRRQGRSVMVFTGFRLEELSASSPLLAACDLLVDGRFERDRPERRRRWIGSENQRMHFFGDRHRPEEPCFTERNQVEIRLSRGELAVHGWPTAAGRVRGR